MPIPVQQLCILVVITAARFRALYIPSRPTALLAMLLRRRVTVVHSCDGGAQRLRDELAPVGQRTTVEWIEKAAALRLSARNV